MQSISMFDAHNDYRIQSVARCKGFIYYQRTNKVLAGSGKKDVKGTITVPKEAI